MPAVGTTHHVKLGNEYLMIRPNSYQKRPAPTFGARITTGDPDYNNLSIWQHWTQTCWIGGMDQDEWLDDAMYDTAVGMDTTNHDVVRLARRLKRGTGANWTAGGATNVLGYKFVIHDTRLYCLVSLSAADSRLYIYTHSTQSWASVTMPGTSFYVRAVCSFDGKLFIGGSVSTPGARLFWATTPGAWTQITNPGGVTTYGVTALRAYNQKLYVGYGNQVWRMKDDETWDGNVVFYKVNAASSSNWIAAMETHLGFLYMLSSNGHLHRTDGNNTFDIWSWDGQTKGVSLRSYDGKLFVGTYEWTDTPDIGFGVLYQFTGAAVTELKRWGRQGKATSIGGMTVYARKLYYGASYLLGMTAGFGIAVYDAVEDAHSVWAAQQDSGTYPDTSGVGTDWLVDDVIVHGGHMFCAVRGHGLFFTPDRFQDIILGEAEYTTYSGGGRLTSSLYDGGTPGLMKLWRRITLHCDLPTGTSLTLSYSIDKGVTYTSFTQYNGPGPANDKFSYYLNNVRAPSIKWKVTFNTSNAAVTPTLRGVIVAYLPQPEPNWMWTFTIPVADKWVLLDETTESLNTEGLIAYIENLFRTQSLTTFIDIDGVSWATNGAGVLVYDISTVHFDIEEPKEADIRITLLEVVETL